MTIRIFQIDLEKDKNLVKFRRLEETQKFSDKVDSSIYLEDNTQIPGQSF